MGILLNILIFLLIAGVMLGLAYILLKAFVPGTAVQIKAMVDGVLAKFKKTS